MKRETRINLIFLAFILAAMLPAAFRMYAKRVNDPERPNMAMPTVMRSDAVYIDPQPQHPSVRFVVPQRLLRWHDKMLAKQFEQHPPTADGNWSRLNGAASTGRTFELLAVADNPDGYFVYLLLWDQSVLPRLSSKSFDLQFSPNIKAGGWQEAPVSIEAASPQPMPYEIRRELKNLGYINPPQSVTLLRLSTSRLDYQPDGIRLGLEPAPDEADDAEPNRSEERLFWDPWKGEESLRRLMAESAAASTDE